jgi:hypothetical protein
MNSPVEFGFYRFSTAQMLFDDNRYVIRFDLPIPSFLWQNSHGRARTALTLTIAALYLHSRNFNSTKRFQHLGGAVF